MALIAGLGLFVVSIFVAALSRIAVEEITAWTPSFIRSLIRFAVERLPKNKRERFEEEWQSHVNEVPGQVGKLLVALGFLIAAYDFSFTDRRNRMLVFTLAQFDEGQCAAMTALNLLQNQERTLPCLEGITLVGLDELRDKCRQGEEKLALGLEGFKSNLAKGQQLRNQLANLIALPAIPPTLVGNLYMLVYSSRMRKLRDQISETTKRLKEETVVTAKLVEQRTRTRAKIVKAAAEWRKRLVS